MIDPRKYELDPVFAHSLRETKTILLIFSVFALFVVGMATTTGFQSAEAQPELATVFGVPSWVFWSIVAPWVVANVVTVWFCYGYMRQDALEEPADIPPPGHDSSPASPQTDEHDHDQRDQDGHA